MRFSIALSHHDLARAEARDESSESAHAGATRAARERLVALARAAEAGGAEAIWVSEDPEGWDAFAILTLLATQTATIRLGTGVTNPLLRHPNQMAAALATLDIVSDGRAFLGIGRGEPAWYRQGLGVPVPPQPLDGLWRTVALLQTWWRPPHHVIAPESNPAGTVFPVRNWQRLIGPWPARTSPPPIVIAAAGPRALRLAGEVADGVLFNDLASDSYLRWAVESVRGSAMAAGRDPATIRFTYGTRVLITDDPETELERRKTTLALINALPGMDRQLAGAGHDIPTLIGAIRDVLGSSGLLATGGGFPELRAQGNLAAAAKLVPTDLVDRLSIVGPTSHVRERLAILTSLGIDEVFVQLPPAGLTADVLRDRLLVLRTLS
jgi:5,10-methylenetetrahydromethanopterin reductase